MKITAFLVAFTSLLLFVRYHTQFLECVTDSLLNVRYLIVLKDAPFKRGDIVSIQGHVVPYTDQTSFAKRVLGLAGDLIIKEESRLRIGNSVLPLLKETHDGRPLTPLGVDVIPQGFVFVAGDHPRSLDSRYAEFGLVPLSKIYGRAIWQGQ